MEVQEVIRLSDWFDEHLDQAINAYTNLVSVLQNNTRQPEKLPVQEPLEDLMKVLAAMPTEQLSLLQFRMLETLEVSDLIGRRGAQWIEVTVKTTTYDPATTFQSAHDANSKLQNAKTQLGSFGSAAAGVGIVRSNLEEETDHLLINIIFQNDVSIENVRDWKKMSAEWEQIIAGLAAAVGERPEDVAVAGVSNGSIIVTLGATAAVTKLLAMISKHIVGIAHDILSVQTKAEELRQARIMTKTMEVEFKQLEQTKRDEGKAEIAGEIDCALPDLEPEIRSKLQKSVDKALAFGEAGGEVDFVLPDREEDEETEVDKAIDEIRTLVEDQQRVRQEVKLLENNTE